MNTTKVLSPFLLAGTMLLGFGCSTTSTTGDPGTTATADTMPGPAGNVGDATNTTTTTPAVVSGSVDAPTGDNTAPTTAMESFTASLPNMQDPVFLLTAGSSNLLEIQTAQLALQKATSPDVKKFAQMMLDHHTKATQELKTIATPLSVTLPEAMMPIHQAMADKLKDASGKKFDEAYMDAMETAHQMDIAMFETKSRTAADPTVKAFATKTLPMLKSHAAMATKLEDKVD
jgi:putative membrane protein